MLRGGLTTERLPIRRTQCGSAPRRVLVFRKLLLPLSETFILDQVASYRRWTPTLLGFQRVPGLELDTVDTVTIARAESLLERLRLKMYQHGQYLGYVPGGLLDPIAAQRPDLIHAHFAYDAILVSDVAKRLAVPLVVTLHGDDILRRPHVWRSGSKGQFFRLYPRKLQALFRDRSVHFIAVSEAVARHAVGEGAMPERVHVRYTGTRSMGQPRGAGEGRGPMVLFVGRLVEFKGCEFLIRAMALVRRALPAARLTVIGDGPLRSELENLAVRLGGGVNFVGAADRQTVQTHMAVARAFCLPSVTDQDGIFEAFGMVILEAMAAGLPVVTSAKGGREALRHGKTGFVVAERDVDGIAAHLLDLLRDDDLFQAIARRAQERVVDFDVQACTAAIETLYDCILADAR